MPSRFEVVPDVAADAALSLSDAFEVGQGWMSVVQINVNGMVQDAGALLGHTVKGFAGNLSNGTVDPTAMLKNASDWLSNQSALLGNTTSVASLAAAHARMPTHAKAALLLAVFVWLFRELLVRSTARSLLRSHGHAHQH